MPVMDEHGGQTVNGVFALHAQLKQDCLSVGRMSLCQLLLMNDATYPWFILVPQRAGIREIFELSREDQRQFLDESCALAAALQQGFKADKLNIAALGNVVPQLHVHHIVRYATDPAWPAPVWGRFPSQPYTSQQLAVTVAKLKSHLAEMKLE